MLCVDLKNLLLPHVPDLCETSRTLGWHQCLYISILVWIRRVSLKQVSRLPSLTVFGLGTSRTAQNAFVMAGAKLRTTESCLPLGPGCWYPQLLSRPLVLPCRSAPVPSRYLLTETLPWVTSGCHTTPSISPQETCDATGKCSGLTFLPQPLANQVWRCQKGKGKKSWPYWTYLDPEIQGLVALSIIRRTCFGCSCLGWMTTWGF